MIVAAVASANKNCLQHSIGLLELQSRIQVRLCHVMTVDLRNSLDEIRHLKSAFTVHHKVTHNTENDAVFCTVLVYVLSHVIVSLVILHISFCHLYCRWVSCTYGASR